VEPFPDLRSLSDDDLKQLIDELTKEELEVSYRRRMLHGKIDLLRAELQARLRKTGGKSVLEQVDVDRLAAILAGKAAPPASRPVSPQPRLRSSIRCADRARNRVS
jgi:hypothetical protein